MLLRACLTAALFGLGALPWSAAQTATSTDATEIAAEEEGEEQVERDTYVVRDMTPEEIAAKEKEWKEKNPFKFSAYMPDYSKMKVREKVTKAKPESTSTRTKELEDRVALLEKQLTASQPADPKAGPAKPAGMAKPVPAQPVAAKPSPPNPANVVMRKLSDGRVIAIIGGKSRTFANEKEAKAFVETLKP